MLQGPAGLLILLATVAPSLVAVVLAAIEGGRRGVGDLLGQGLRWRFGIGWYVVAVFVSPLLWAVALVIGSVLRAGKPELRTDFLIPIAAIGEEFGWRGYALPRLKVHVRPLPAALLIGVIWAAWHLPYFAFPEIHPLPFAIEFPLFALMLISQSVLATWIYNSTRGSVLATMVYHHSIHVATLIPIIPGIAGGVVMALVHVAAATIAAFVSGGSLVGVRTWRVFRPRITLATPH